MIYSTLPWFDEMIEMSVPLNGKRFLVLVRSGEPLNAEPAEISFPWYTVYKNFI